MDIMNEFLILVDENDKELGKSEKMVTHQLGLLHRAFSVFLFNPNGELLLQQRSDSKYHSAGLWSNSCCSHPNYGEKLPTAIERRLLEELGMKCKTTFAFSFLYKAELAGDIIEHEFDHVYFGVTNDLPMPTLSEVQNWKYLDLNSLEQDLNLHSERYTAWLKICFPAVKKFFKNDFCRE